MSSVAKLYGGNPGLSPAPAGGRRRRMSKATRRMLRMRGGVEEPMPTVAPVPPVVAPVAPVPPVPSAPPVDSASLEEVGGRRRRRSRSRSRRRSRRHRSRRYRAGLFA